MADLPPPWYLLIVEDDEGLAELEARSLRRHGFDCRVVRTLQAARTALTLQAAALAIVDYRLPDGSAEDLLDWAEQAGISLPMVVVTGQGGEEIAVRMLGRGVLDYVVKGTETIRLLPGVVERALRQEQLSRELRLAQDRYKMIVTNMADVISLHRVDGTTLYVSPSARRLLGAEAPEHLIMAELIHPDDFKAVEEQWIRLVTTGQPLNVEYRIAGTDGRWIWLETESHLTQGPDAPESQVIATTRNVTKRKEAEERETIYTESLEALGVVNPLIGMQAGREPDQGLTHVIHRLTVALRMDAAMLFRKEGDLLTLVSGVVGSGPVSAGRSIASDAQVLAPCWDAPNTPVEIPVGEGSRALGMADICPEQMECLVGIGLIGQGGPVGLLCLGSHGNRSLSDVDRRLLSAVVQRLALILENALLHEQIVTSEAQYRGLVEGATDLIWETDDQGRLAFVNQAAASILGVPPQELLGKELLQVLQPEAIDAATIQQALNRAERVEFVGQARRPDGEPVLLSVGGYARRRADYDRPTGYAGIARDETLHRRMEERLQASQKLESIGRLTGGIAHDFNNILTGVLISAQLILEDLPEEHESRQDAETIVSLSQRAASLIHQLLAFGRRQTMALAPIQLSPVVREMGELVTRTMGAQIEVRFELQDDLPTVKADVSQIEQVILNLAVNAEDAMPFGGTLSIRTYLSSQRTHAVPNEECYVVLEVADTGIGMDESVRQRCFEPYFTTKSGTGSGTGLGLATVHGVVTQHGGFIDVESRPNQGSRFRVYLPCDKVTPALPETPAIQPSPASNGPRCRILVAEDEEPVRRLIKRILQGRQYPVLAVQNGAEAVALFKTDGDFIDLVLMDAVMPVMNGREAMAAIRQCSPTTPVLFMSGYAQDVLGEEALSQPGVFFLGKPFSPDELVQKVEQALAGRQPRGTPPAGGSL